MTEEELKKLEEEQFTMGPLKILTDACKLHGQVLINLRDNKKVLGRIRAFDRYV